MARTALEVWEVALIKTMLARGYPNKTIQFYFNTPERAVNSGRISEIKGEDRWQEIEAATQYELDEYIDNHPLRENFSPKEEPQPPRQNDSASNFTVTDQDEIDIVPDPPSGPEDFEEALIELHDELQKKCESTLALGHNLLGDISQSVERFKEVVQRDRARVSTVRLWSRGNSLRAALRAHDAVANREDMHPAKLDVACAAALRDLVEAFNIYVASDPKGVELDRLALGPQEKEVSLEALAKFKLIYNDAPHIATRDAIESIADQLAASDSAPEGPEGEKDIALAEATSQNFVLTLILGSYRRIRRIAGKGLSALWRDFSTGVVTAIGGIAAIKLVAFVAEHSAVISAYVDMVMANPAVQKILEFVLSVI